MAQESAAPVRSRPAGPAADSRPPPRRHGLEWRPPSRAGPADRVRARFARHWGRLPKDHRSGTLSRIDRTPQPGASMRQARSADLRAGHASLQGHINGVCSAHPPLLGIAYAWIRGDRAGAGLRGVEGGGVRAGESGSTRSGKWCDASVCRPLHSLGQENSGWFGWAGDRRLTQDHEVAGSSPAFAYGRGSSMARARGIPVVVPTPIRALCSERAGALRLPGTWRLRFESS